MGEIAATSDHVVRALQLEEKQPARFECTEADRTPGLPEVDLVYPRATAKEIEPSGVRHSKKSLHRQAPAGVTPSTIRFTRRSQCS